MMGKKTTETTETTETNETNETNVAKAASAAKAAEAARKEASTWRPTKAVLEGLATLLPYVLDPDETAEVRRLVRAAVEGLLAPGTCAWNQEEHVMVYAANSGREIRVLKTAATLAWGPAHRWVVASPQDTSYSDALASARQWFATEEEAVEAVKAKGYAPPSGDVHGCTLRCPAWFGARAT